MRGRVLSFAVCAFVGFTVALGGLVVFATFPTNIVGTFTFRGMVSKLLAFVALDQLKLGCVFLCTESPMFNVDSMLDAVVTHVWASEENH